MRVYVAGASKEPGRVRQAMDWVDADPNLELTQDWLTDIENEVSDDQLTHDQRVHYAFKDLSAVWRSKVIWVLIPNNQSVGCWVELGYALGAGRPGTHVVISGKSQGVIFCAMGMEFGEDEAAFFYVQKIGLGL